MVQDVNDNAPVFSSSVYSGIVPEDALVGTSILQVQATDADTGLNGRVRYKILKIKFVSLLTRMRNSVKTKLYYRYSLTAPGSDVIADNSFVIDPSSGVIRTSKNLDRESVAQYALHVYAIDRGSPAMSSSVRYLDWNLSAQY